MIFLLFLFLLSFILKLNCLYNNEIKEVNLNMNQNLIDNSKTLLVGNVYEEFLYYSKKYEFNFNKTTNTNITLYFHFYPLDDCHIIISSNDTSVEIEEKKIIIIIYSTLKFYQKKY